MFPMIASPILRAIGIKGFVAIGLAIALVFVMWRADTLSHRLAKSEEWVSDVTAATRLASGVDDLPREKVAQQVMFLGEGVNTLKGEIDKLNLAAKARADAFARSQQEAAREADRLKRQASASQGQIDRLRALAASGGRNEACEVPAELQQALDGL